MLFEFSEFSLLRSVFFADENSDWTFTDAIWATTEKENEFPPRRGDFQKLSKFQRAFAPIFSLCENFSAFRRGNSTYFGGMRAMCWRITRKKWFWVDFAHALTFGRLERVSEPKLSSVALSLKSSGLTAASKRSHEGVWWVHCTTFNVFQNINNGSVRAKRYTGLSRSDSRLHN